MADAQAEYASRVKQYAAALEALDRRGATLANLRLLTFLLWAGLGFASGMRWLPRWVLLPSLGFLATYIALAVVHAGVIRRESVAKVKKLLNERGLARLAGAWHDFPSTGAGAVPDGHVYAGDLDLTGKGSLFQRLDETGTAAGERRLLEWLLAPAPDRDSLVARQVAVEELAALVDFRQDLVAEARLAGRADKADPSKFLQWAEAPSPLRTIRWAAPVAHLLPAVTITLGVLASNELLSGVPFMVGLSLQIVVVFLTRGPIAQMWEALSLGERGFVRFEETFRAIDAQRFAAPRLQALQRGLSGSMSVTERLKRFARLMGFAELKSSGQLHPIINALTLWDLLVLFRIERWRAEHGAGVRGWFEALAELEALSSFATWRFERPDDVFPSIDTGDLKVEATGLGHPLLDAPVRNDVRLAEPGAALIITGSNMSGKTTLMRALGLNTVMALAGLPVCARSFSVTRVQVLTSMRVKDSLERGVSYFYAEVQRVKTLLDTARANPKACLFFLDELFMGTNAKERQIASRALLLRLLDLGASGAVTTHDLSITELALERPSAITNVHFRDEIKAGDMVFDYRLRPGVVQTTNALEVLRRAGVDVT